MTSPHLRHLFVVLLTAFAWLVPTAIHATNVGTTATCTDPDRCCDEATGQWMNSADASKCAENPQSKDPAAADNNSLDIIFNLGRAPFARPANFSAFFQASTESDEKNRLPTTMQGMRAFYNSNSMTGLWNAELKLQQPMIDANAFKLTNLEYNHTQLMEVLKEGSEIRQVKTHDFFVDFRSLPSPQEGFEVRWWFADEVAAKPANAAFYSIPSVDSTKQVIVSNPTPFANYDVLDLNMRQDMPNGSIRRLHHRYRSVPAGQGDSSFPEFVLETWTGSPTDANSKQVFENRLAYLSGVPTNSQEPDNQTRIRTFKIADLSSDGVYGPLQTIGRIREEFVSIGGKRRRVKDVLLEDLETTTNGPTTTYGYYNAPLNSITHSRPRWRKNPDGSWTIWQVTGTVSSQTVKTITPFMDTPGFVLADDGSNVGSVPLDQCKVVTEIITGTSLETYTEVLGQQVSRTVETFSKGASGERISKTRRYLSANNASFIESQTAYFAHGSSAKSGRLAWRTREDGTATIYSYTGLSGGGTEVIAATGATDGTNFTSINSITAGTKITTHYNEFWVPFNEVRQDIESGETIGSWAAMSQDLYGRPTKIVHNGVLEDHEETTYDCCGPTETRGRNGAITNTYYDILKRPYKMVRRRSSTGPAVTTLNSYNGLTTTTERTDGTTTLFVNEVTQSLDRLTRISRGPDVDNDPNTDYVMTSVTAYPATSGSVTTTTYPDQTTTSTATYRDGQTRSATDQENHATLYTYGVHTEEDGGLISTVDLPGSGESTTTYYDRLGRMMKMVYADDAETTHTYFGLLADADNPRGSLGKLKSTTDPDNVTTTSAYNSEGEQTTTVTPLPNDANGNAQERTIFTETNVISTITLQGTTIAPAIETKTKVNGITTAKSYRSVDGRVSGSLSFGRESLSITTVPNDGTWTTTTIAADGSQTRSYYEDGLMIASASFESGATLPTSAPADITNVTATGFITGSSMTHDAFGRVLNQTDARTGTTTMGTYLDNGSLLSVTDPGNRETQFTYDKMGRRLTIDAPDTIAVDTSTNQPINSPNITHTSYTDRGQIKSTWGDQTYPRAYEYDAQGRMTHLHTYQTLAHGTEPTLPGEAVTQWNYHDQRGWLTEKNYHGETNNGPGNTADYTYTSAGRLATRTWERGVVTTYAYTQGLLTGVTYSGETNGHTTPNLAYTYDNFGRIDQVTRGGLLHADYDYDATNLQLTNELLNIDTPVSHTLTRYYDNLLRPQSISFAGGAHTYSYEYDTAGRLGTVYHQPTLDAQGQRTGGGKAFTYQYLPESGNLLETVTSPTHTVTNTWEAGRNVLERKANNKTTDNRLLSRYTYDVNDIGQRTQTELYGWAFNADPNAGNISSSKQTHFYRYNQRGEVTERDYEDSGANQVLQENYQFDAIGNRLSTTHRRDNVDTVGNYTANTQNQYTAVPGGIAMSHDDDGNLLSGPVPGDSASQNPDGSNSNVPVAATNLIWDAENRLVAIDMPDGTVTYAYDYLSRRIRNDGLRNTEGENYFYDGWNLIAMSWGSDSTVSCYWTWGLDLSGSLQGAGGVGGLLATNHTGTDYYPLYDGNGNVGQYIDDNGDFAARWEYDAFGRTTKSYSDQGTLAHWFFHRFSTKHQDYDTGLYYYGYRYYDPVTGRWPSRDPIEELILSAEKTAVSHEHFEIEPNQGLLIIKYENQLLLSYTFIKNGPLNKFDKVGLIAAVTNPKCKIISGKTKSRCLKAQTEMRWVRWRLVARRFCVRAVCFWRCRCKADNCYCKNKFCIKHGMEYGPKWINGNSKKPARCTPGAAFAKTKKCKADGSCCE